MDELNHVLNLLRSAERIVTDEEGVNYAIPSVVEIPKILQKFIDKKYIKFLDASSGIF